MFIYSILQNTVNNARNSYISKRGDRYLRTLLIHGARAVIRFAKNKTEPNIGINKLLDRRNKNVVAVALANKNARIIWVLLTKNTVFKANFSPKTVNVGV